MLVRYRKYNLYGEEHIMDRPLEGPDVSFFDTDFGVRFGLLICFDLMHFKPWEELQKIGVNALVLSAAWTDEVPFLTGLYSMTSIK